jgi:hypothetical protein
MASDTDPDLRSAVDLRFTEVVENELLVGTEVWDQHGRTRLVLREGPHPPGMAEGGRQAWESMFAKLDTLLEGPRRPA